MYAKNDYLMNIDGWMEPDEHLSHEDKVIAQSTIDMYNLNSPELRQKRQGIILQLRSMSQMTDDDVRMCTATIGFSFLVSFVD